MKSRLSILLLALLAFVANPAQAASGVLADVTTDRARYDPGAGVVVTVALANTSHAVQAGTVRLQCQHLEAVLAGPPASQAFRLAPGRTVRQRFVWQPPRTDFQGYRVEAVAFGPTGRSLGGLSTAVDVSSTWTRFPRYGYVSAFPRQSAETSARTIRRLKRYHVNAVQFYDWQFKHHAPLAGTVAHPAASWTNLANGNNSRQTVLDEINSAHACGMAAMEYNLLYGAWSGCGGDGVESHWGLWNRPDGTDQDRLPMPGGWATPAIYLFNPADPGWQEYLLSQEAAVFAAYPFDGWHVDQIGERGLKYDSAGHPVDVWKTFRPFLNAAKARLNRQIVFNNVGGYGLYDTAAHSTEDAVYVECWDFAGQRSYHDLKRVIDQAASWSGGKGVILPAYMDYGYARKFSNARPGAFNPPGVLLTDAVIFASGGTHLEMGDGGFLLDSEYFPNHALVPSAALLDRLQNYYDFQVAYENLLCDNLTGNPNAVRLSAPFSADGSPNAVWAFAKASGGTHTINLINLIGERNTAWKDDNADYPPPTPQTDVTVKYYSGSRVITKAYWASPDVRDGRTMALPYRTGTDGAGRYVQLTVPSLAYWDMIVLDVK